MLPTRAPFHLSSRFLSLRFLILRIVFCTYILHCSISSSFSVFCFLPYSYASATQISVTTQPLALLRWYSHKPEKKNSDIAKWKAVIPNTSWIHQQEKPAYAIVKKEVINRLQLHGEELKLIATEVVKQILTYLQSLARVYVLGLALLIPFSSQMHQINRVHLNDPYLLSLYDLPPNATPDIWGLSFSSVRFQSTDDESAVLAGWFIPSANSQAKKAIICVHGWFGNRQSCLPFLKIAKSIGLLRDHHILMIDLRNSGNSSSVDDDIGLKAAHDIYDTIWHLKKELNITDVSIYSQSIGSMATLLMADLYKARLEKIGVYLNRIILDSPIVNALEAMKVQPGAQLVRRSASWVYDGLVWLQKQRFGQLLDNMKASTLLQSLDPSRVMILQSKVDPYATWNVLRSELSALPMASRPGRLYLFDQGLHGNLFNTNPGEYKRALRQFFCQSSLLHFIRDRLPMRNGVRRISKKDI